MIDPLRVFSAGTVSAARSSPPARNGLLLLLGAFALTVLALAGGSLQRLLRKLDEGLPS